MQTEGRESVCVILSSSRDRDDSFNVNERWSLDSLALGKARGNFGDVARRDSDVQVDLMRRSHDPCRYPFRYDMVVSGASATTRGLEGNGNRGLKGKRE